MATTRTKMGRTVEQVKSQDIGKKRQRQSNYTKATKEGVLKVARKIKQVWVRKMQH